MLIRLICPYLILNHHQMEASGFFLQLKPPKVRRFQNYLSSPSPNLGSKCTPLMYWTSLLVNRCGSAETIRWTWSFDTCPAKISTLFPLRMPRISSLVLFAICPVSTAFRYFAIHTIWYFISYTQCADLRYSVILSTS